MSAQAWLFSVIWWWSWLTVVDRLMRRRRNRQPAGTALAAKDSFPINERRRRFDVFRHPNQDSSSCKRSFSLAGGRCSSLCWESSSIPRYVIIVDGPSSLSIATGTPRVEHSCSMSCTDCAHLGESGGPMRKNHPGSGLGWPGGSLLGSNEWQWQID